MYEVTNIKIVCDMPQIM